MATNDETPEITPELLQMQLSKIVGEIHTAMDYAKELDCRDECMVDIYRLEDMQNIAEELSNVADGVEE